MSGANGAVCQADRMNRLKVLLATVAVPAMLLGGAGCSSDDDDASPSTTAAASSDASSDESTETTETTQAPADDRTPPHVEAAMSSGATFSGKPDECTVDGRKATVRALGDELTITLTDGTGPLSWATDSGVVSETVSAIMRDGGFLTTGVTASGDGWNIDVQCT